jgi:hypothetical protein
MQTKYFATLIALHNKSKVNLYKMKLFLKTYSTEILLNTPDNDLKINKYMCTKYTTMHYKIVHSHLPYILVKTGMKNFD